MRALSSSTRLRYSRKPINQENPNWQKLVAQIETHPFLIVNQHAVHPRRGLLSPRSTIFSFPIPCCIRSNHPVQILPILANPFPTFMIPQSLALQTPCFCSYILSVLILCCRSTVMATQENVVNIDARVVDDEIMKTIIIWSRAACCTEDPPRIAPVIIPGIAIIPRTLFHGRGK